MNNLKVINAQNQHELDTCLKIRHEVFILEKNIPQTIEIDKYDVLNSNCNHFFIQFKGVSVGALRCMHLQDNSVQIQRFCLLKEYRNCGLGKDTMKYLEAYYREKQISYIILHAKYDVSGFYEACGYQKISDVFIEADVPHIKMSKTL